MGTLSPSPNTLTRRGPAPLVATGTAGGAEGAISAFSADSDARSACMRRASLVGADGHWQGKCARGGLRASAFSQWTEGTHRDAAHIERLHAHRRRTRRAHAVENSALLLLEHGLPSFKRRHDLVLAALGLALVALVLLDVEGIVLRERDVQVAVPVKYRSSASSPSLQRDTNSHFRLIHSIANNLEQHVRYITLTLRGMGGSRTMFCVMFVLL